METHPILNGHSDYPVVISVDEIDQVLSPVANSVATTMHPDQDRQLVCIGWGIDVQEKAVLTSIDARSERRPSFWRLEASFAESICRFDGTTILSGHFGCLPS